MKIEKDPTGIYQKQVNKQLMTVAVYKKNWDLNVLIPHPLKLQVY
jgi:hypothetical protein